MDGFQHRLYDLRKRAGLSQEELANLLGVTRQAVQKWEAGTSRPDMDNLLALADHFGVTLDWLAAGREEQRQPVQNVIVERHYYKWDYEFKSEITVFGLPLVHIRFGPVPCCARGIVAIGNMALGVVALGGVSVGLFSLGGLSLGLLIALGGAAVGAFALGAFALGLLAWGGIALGWLAVGGIARGTFAVGALAWGGRIAIGSVARGPLAIGREAAGALTYLTGGVSQGAIEGAIRAAAPGQLAELLCRLAGML